MEHVTNPQHLEAPAFALGIDTSSNKLDLALLSAAGELRTKRISNDETGFETLLSWLSRSTKDFHTVHASAKPVAVTRKPSPSFSSKPAFA